MDQRIEQICDNDEFNVRMVTVSMTDSMREDSIRIQKGLINKLSNDCVDHPGEKELNMCITCGITFCDKCKSKHNNHQTITKHNLIDYKKEIEEKKKNIYEDFLNLGIDPNKGITNGDNMCIDLRDEMTQSMEKLKEIVQGIDSKKNILYNDFKSDFNSIYPILLEYKEKIDNLSEATIKQSTIQQEKELLDFYIKYKSTKDSYNTINNKVNELKDKINDFKEILKELIKKTQITIESIKKEFYGEDLEVTQLNNKRSKNNFSLNNTFDNKSQFDTRSGKFSMKSGNEGQRLNLVNLLSPGNNKKSFVKEIKNEVRERRSSRSPSSKLITSSNMLKHSKFGKNTTILEEDEISNINLSDPTCYYNIDISSNNLIKYSIKEKKITKIKVDINKTRIKRFEAYHSTLNFNGRFYISGGYSSNKMFYIYNSKKNEFIKLEDMISGHSYHCLIGINDFIFAISGYKSKKVEKYNINTNKWESLPEIEKSRSLPGCANVDDTFILIFGGLIDKTETTNNIIEKLNIKEPKSWEKMEINFSQPIPIFFGVVNFNNETVYLFGGKLNQRLDDVDSCYKFNCQNGVLEKESITLPEKDEFNGKSFFRLNDNLFGAFSAINSDKFYIYNIESKEFEIITSES